jgi:hypothetical protein
MLGNKIHSSILGGFQSRPTYRTIGPGPEQRPVALLGNKIHSSILGGFQSRPPYRTVGLGPIAEWQLSLYQGHLLLKCKW